MRAARRNPFSFLVSRRKLQSAPVLLASSIPRGRDEWLLGRQSQTTTRARLDRTAAHASRVIPSRNTVSLGQSCRMARCGARLLHPRQRTPGSAMSDSVQGEERTFRRAARSHRFELRHHYGRWRGCVRGSVRTRAKSRDRLGPMRCLIRPNRARRRMLCAFRAAWPRLGRTGLDSMGSCSHRLSPTILNRIAVRGPISIPLAPPPLEPIVPTLRKRYPTADDDEILLRHFFDAGLVEKALKSKPDLDAFMSIDTPLVRLIKEASRRPRSVAWLNPSCNRVRRAKAAGTAGASSRGGTGRPTACARRCPVAAGRPYGCRGSGARMHCS